MSAAPNAMSTAQCRSSIQRRMPQMTDITERGNSIVHSSADPIDRAPRVGHREHARETSGTLDSATSRPERFASQTVMYVSTDAHRVCWSAEPARPIKSIIVVVRAVAAFARSHAFATSEHNACVSEDSSAGMTVRALIA